jgi:hypothetical protein
LFFCTPYPHTLETAVPLLMFEATALPELVVAALENTDGPWKSLWPICEDALAPGSLAPPDVCPTDIVLPRLVLEATALPEVSLVVPDINLEIAHLAGI